MGKDSCYLALSNGETLICPQSGNNCGLIGDDRKFKSNLTQEQVASCPNEEIRARLTAEGAEQGH
jgi:hypothetical protein